MVDYESIADDARQEILREKAEKRRINIIVTIQPPPIDVSIYADYTDSDEEMLEAAIESLWLPDIKDYDMSDVDIESSTFIRWEPGL